MVMATSLLFGACSGDGKTCDRATQQKGNTENVIGRSDIKVKDGRMTPEVLWAMGGEELTMMQSWIIRFLYEHSEEDIYQRDIEAEFSIARSTATGILKLMEKRGYIRRVSVERDARLKKLELTEVGIRMQEGTIRNINRLESTLRQGISDEDLEVFFRVIRKMRSNIEIQQGETNRRRE